MSFFYCILRDRFGLAASKHTLLVLTNVTDAALGIDRINFTPVRAERWRILCCSERAHVAMTAGRKIRPFLTLKAGDFPKPPCRLRQGHIFRLRLALQHYYRLTSRELKRLSSISLSPIYAHFNESLLGITTIKAFKKTEMFRCSPPFCDVQPILFLSCLSWGLADILLHYFYWQPNTQSRFPPWLLTAQRPLFTAQRLLFAAQSMKRFWKLSRVIGTLHRQQTSPARNVLQSTVVFLFLAAIGTCGSSTPISAATSRRWRRKNGSPCACKWWALSWWRRSLLPPCSSVSFRAVASQRVGGGVRGFCKLKVLFSSFRIASQAALSLVRKATSMDRRCSL